MCVNFVSCGDDDDDDRSGVTANFIGKWKIEKINYEEKQKNGSRAKVGVFVTRYENK
jgi:hypothetical protein